MSFIPRRHQRKKRILNDFTARLIEEFKANAGQVGPPFEHARLLLLTTTGARTGRPRTAILGYYPDGGRVLVVGSAGGSPNHPAWYHNLLADPQVSVDVGLFSYPATALVLRGAERDEVFARLVEADAGWGQYQAAVTRTIPVVALVPGGPPGGGRGSLAEALKNIHAAFRRELALIRHEIATSGVAGLGAQLRINCLTLCQGLHYHHTGESTMLFPGLLERHPELADAIAVLQHEHEQIAVLLDQLKQEVSLAQVDELIAQLNAHLDREEAELLPYL
ncbi:nitroreductase/quinone reductase family protein [Kribbella jejuensis]|uniref:Deazaflavin-dependent oxidoreductase (Nitroreductase family) n=1 Tax=Kribbella jejuensis TaxID=236068 RepID=A0A542EVZ1_9ACTN|nr:nitroreductase/quinone reductase family protein [Kribbella jejuensis]TQJ19374.1 deazaflavin-dependent oxidoreductase (nitroreductase family) [Kribbella jejuensis]